MSLKTRLAALERDQRIKGSTAHRNAVEAETLRWLDYDQRYAASKLADLIGGPVEVHLSASMKTAPDFALYELVRCAWACGQQWLRLDAKKTRHLIEKHGDELREHVSAELADIERIVESYERRADQLDAWGVPDMTTKAHVPMVAGDTWQHWLAWALALGDKLDDELRSVQWFDWFSPAERERAMLFGGKVYESPLDQVPPLPDYLLEGVGENPYPCEPFIYGDGSCKECP